MKEISLLLIMNPGLDVDTRVVEEKSSHSKKSKTEKPAKTKSEVARKTKKGMENLKKTKRAFTQSRYGWNVKESVEESGKPEAWHVLYPSISTG